MPENIPRATVVLAAFAALVLLLLPSTGASAGVAVADTQAQVLFSGANISVEISKGYPSLLFNCPGHEERGLVAEYTRIIGFNDTGDGTYQGSEAVFIARLSEGAWSVRAWTEGQGSSPVARAEATSNVDITLTGSQNNSAGVGQGSGQPAPSPQPGGIVRNALRLTFTYELHEINVTYGSPSAPLTLRGGAEAKIGMAIVPLAAIPSTHLCIEQSLRREGSIEPQQFKLFDGLGEKLADGSVNEIQGSQEVMHRFADRAEEQQRVGYVTSSGAEEGFYTWTARVEARRASGSSNGSLSTSYRTDGSSLKLYAAFRQSSDVSEYVIDPTIGTIPEAIEEIAAAIVDYVTAHRQSLAIGVVIGAAVAVSAVAAKSSRGKGGDGAASIERNPYFKGGKAR